MKSTACQVHTIVYLLIIGTIIADFCHKCVFTLKGFSNIPIARSSSSLDTANQARKFLSEFYDIIISTEAKLVSDLMKLQVFKLGRKIQNDGSSTVRFNGIYF